MAKRTIVLALAVLALGAAACGDDGGGQSDGKVSAEEGGAARQILVNAGYPAIADKATDERLAALVDVVCPAVEEAETKLEAEAAAARIAVELGPAGEADSGWVPTLFGVVAGAACNDQLEALDG